MNEFHMTGWRKAVAVIVLALPLIVTGLMTAKALYDQKSYPLIKVKIAGYDPRDMLRGQYLRYQFDWNWEEGQPDASVCTGGDQKCCLCLKGEKMDPQGHLSSCTDPAIEQCPAVLEGHIRGGQRFHIGHDQYFVPEEYARSLEKLLQDDETTLRMGLSVRPDGKAVIEDLYIGHYPLADYLRLYAQDLKSED